MCYFADYVYWNSCTDFEQQNFFSAILHCKRKLMKESGLHFKPKKKHFLLLLQRTEIVGEMAENKIFFGPENS